MIKGHGSGNDFFLIDEITNEYQFADEERSFLARLLCHRDSDLGADGILFVLKSERADGRMRVFNADGSEASMCGNGLRLVARYLCELLGKETAVVETMKADLKVGKRPELFPEVHTFQVEISPVLFDVNALPLKINQPTLFNEKIHGLSDDLRFTAVAVPNPHLITLVDVDRLQSPIQEQISKKVNGSNDLFPDGVNVSFVNVLNLGAIYVRTFERGVGFTNACGTAMSASSLVTCMQGLNSFESTIDVYNNGGKVQCVVHRFEEKYKIDLIGNATYLFKAAVEVDLENGAFTVREKQAFTEQLSYEKLQSEVQHYLHEFIEG